mgnify:CR=1 FL=1
MKTAKQVAEKVTDKNKHNRQYPVGKAQQTILDALNITNCNGHSHAQQIFDELGIVVSSKRVGRKSVPVVEKATIGGGFNAYGEGEESYTPSIGIDLSAISEWMMDN